MANLKKLYQDADWKTEKHIPAIEILENNKNTNKIKIMVTVGKQIPHPNTTEHHIRWIELYFQPKEEKFPYQLGRFEFNAHGEDIKGPNVSTIYTEPFVIAVFKTEKEGTIFASSYCNIHGLWESSLELKKE